MDNHSTIRLKTLEKTTNVLLFFGFINALFAVVILLDILYSWFGCKTGGCGAGTGLLMVSLPSLLNIIIFGIILITTKRDFKFLPEGLKRSQRGQKINSKNKLTIWLLLSPLILTFGYFLIGAVVAEFMKHL